MKLKQILGWSSGLCLCATIAQAQETNQPADFDQRLIQMQERFEQHERDLEARFEKKIAAQDEVIHSLQQRLAVMPTNPPAALAAEATPTNTVSPGLFKELSDKVDNVVEAQKNHCLASLIPPSGSWEKLFSPIAVKARM